MHKILHLLGLLLAGPKSGYDLHRILRAHGDLYADLKKANVYYLLDRLATEGYLTVQTESGARGPRRERLIYSITDSGRVRFEELLRDVLSAPEPSFSSVGAAVIFLDRLPRREALNLLQERQTSTLARRAEVAALADPLHGRLLTEVAIDHLLSLIDADLAWTTRTLNRLQVNDWGRAEHDTPESQDHSLSSDATEATAELFTPK